MNSPQFQLYNASAGSGKTFTLVKEYLKILLSSNYPDAFKQILAITFTNKAVAEMKERVIKNLRDFADEEVLDDPSDMFSVISADLKINALTLHTRAKNTLTHLLHNYAFFDIVTIDKFNHRLLRTFAFDLKLPMNFEVALDTELLLEQAVDNLLYKVGDDKLLTNILIDFAIEKADDDKSWDITRDLRKITKLLLQENHNGHIAELQGKTLEDFQKIGAFIKKLIKEKGREVIDVSKQVLSFLKSNNLEFTDFNGQYLPKFFQKISEGNLDVGFTAAWQLNIADATLYPKRVSAEVADTIDGLQPQIVDFFNSAKEGIVQIGFLKNFYKNLIPLSLLNAINKELQGIKTDQDLLLISDFNNTISKAIANQPAPFIYERLGEKYRHYFIDEFQDTSQMQWDNLQPLVANALESENLTGKRGTLLIVGDAKQAIYRWRGGKAEQFIKLYNKINPFQVGIHVESLPKNFRSFDEVINFNNNFFKHLSQFLSNPDYRDLFENKSSQETNQKKGGYVNLCFLEKDKANDEAYCQSVLRTVQELIAEAYPLKDVCILTRKKKEGLQIAGFLAENNIPIISSETLLLKNNEKIDFLINLISLAVQPNHKEAQVLILQFLAEKHKVEHVHGYISKNLEAFEAFLNEQGFNQNIFLQLPFYNALEYAITSFKLYEGSDAYLQYFLDIVLDFGQQQNGNFSEFLDYWEKKKDTLSIVAPQGIDAVQIMTVHKSKGLEFPVVIYPYAETDVYREPEPKIWFPVEEKTFGLKNALLNKNQSVADINDLGAELFEEYQSKLELDQFNILYVALTRAVERLYVIGKKDMDNKGNENLKSFSGLFINYLKQTGDWADQKSSYGFGVKTRNHREKQGTIYLHEEIPFISNATFNTTFKVVTKSGSLWDTTQQTAIERGNLYHFILSKIKKISDVEDAVDEASVMGTIPESEKETIKSAIKKVVEHPQLKTLFSSDDVVYNEKEIYTASGESIRPDRINISKDKKAIIIDYKTGNYDDKYKKQLHNYADALSQMGFIVTNTHLIFINETIEVLSFKQ